MKSFPKKYNPKDLRDWSNKYNENQNSEGNSIFTKNTLSSSQKLIYRDFFSIYLNDFSDKFQYLKDRQNGINNEYKQLFVVSGNQLENLCSNFEFFQKKNQNLLQIGRKKLEKRTISTSRKNLNANNKILENYLCSSHKIYIPDSDLYLYVLRQLKSLRGSGKLRHETKIGYWSFDLQTSIPSEKITRKEEKRPYYILKYFIGAKAEALPVYVENDIDLCCGDVALLVHPKDKRYNKHIGKNVIIPLCNRQIPIIGDENVNIAVDNGIKRVCPCSDPESILLAKKFGLPTDIYVFNKEGLYTDYIHEKAFIGKERKKYYDNIVGFIEDIGNVTTKGEKLVNVPYIEQIGERLVPYKMDYIIADFEEEKQRIIDKIINNELNFSFINEEKFGEIINNSGIESIENKEPDDETFSEDETDNELESTKIRESLINKINGYLPDSLVCNIQIPFGLRIPLIKDSEGNLKFFDIEKDYLEGKNDSLQSCFDLILLILVRAGIIGMYMDENHKICEYNKFYGYFLENEKRIEHFIQYLSELTGNKPQYNDFLKIIENLSNENNSSTNDLYELIDNSKFLKHEGNRLLLNIQGLINDIIDPDFVQLCIPCYLKNKGIEINKNIVFGHKDTGKIFKELLIQEALLGNNISNNYYEEEYNQKSEFLGNKELTKLQQEQKQWDLFSIYGENPIRLGFLINKTFDQREILLNYFLLKQIWNATRLCIQKDFLPENIGETLDNPTKDFDDFDIIVLDKLRELFYNRKNINTYKEYVKFFNDFKESIQNIFFSRYLEIQKVHPTKNVKFVCSYFFNFLLTTLYPLVPEFVEALQYISGKNFLNPVKPIEIDTTANYNMNILYNTFIKIKEMKLECNIKQHENCNIFIKSTPTIGDIFSENEQIFKNYFHISNINYLRLHEPNLLGYDIFTNDEIILGIQSLENQNNNEKVSAETLEKEIKNLDDKLNLIRQRIQILPEGEQRTKAEEEYAKTKEEIENLTIKYSLLNSK